MTDTAFDRLARRASADPYFLGFHLAEFARFHNLDDDALAARLGCDAAVLPHVRLCLAPRTATNAEFRDDVTCVAAKFGLRLDQLAAAAKVGVARVKVADAPADAAGMILAARDREAPS